MFSIRNLPPRTLLARFIVIITVPTIIGQLLAVFLFYDRHWYNVSYYTSNLIANEIVLLLGNYEYNSGAQDNLTQEYLNINYRFTPNVKLSRKQQKYSEELEIFKNILNSKINKKNIVFINSNGQIEAWFEMKNGLMKIFFSSKILMNPTTYIFVLWVLFLTIILLAISVIFSRNQIRSILELASAADAFGKGLPYSYKPSGAREIRRTGIAFLKMKESIERQVVKRTQMLAMISHDLCTPLTRMKLQLELMPESEETKDLQQDIETMQQMITSYLAFVKGEGGEEFQIINLSLWFKNFIASKYPSSKIEYIPDTTKKMVQIKYHAFQRAISNIINNADKYSSEIKISIYSTETNIVIDIEDNGIGINDEEKKLVFKPFYRQEHSRPLDNSSNVGLGLAITKEIITGHYGNILLQDSRSLGGLLVKITLPIFKKQL